MFLTIWQDCVFFCFFCFIRLMDRRSVKENQVVYDGIQVVGNSGASPTMMDLHDVLRNIEQMLASFKYCIEGSETGMAQSSSYGISSSYGTNSSHCSNHSCKGT
jgi:hypothetical protein